MKERTRDKALLVFVFLIVFGEYHMLINYFYLDGKKPTKFIFSVNIS